MSLSISASAPFNLRSGAIFAPAQALPAQLDGYSQLQVPGAETVWATGEVDLGQSLRLLRYYLDDEDYWLQVLMQGEQPGDTVLFGYHSALAVQDQAHVQALIGAGSQIGLPICEHDGYLYSRQWCQGQGQADWVALHEQVRSPDGRYGIAHQSMLYARDTGLLERREFVLYSLEQDEQGAMTFTTSLGVTLFPTDFQVS